MALRERAKENGRVLTWPTLAYEWSKTSDCHCWKKVHEVENTTWILQRQPPQPLGPSHLSELRQKFARFGGTGWGPVIGVRRESAVLGPVQIVRQLGPAVPRPNHSTVQSDVATFFVSVKISNPKFPTAFTKFKWAEGERNGDCGLAHGQDRDPSPPRPSHQRIPRDLNAV